VAVVDGDKRLAAVVVVCYLGSDYSVLSRRLLCLYLGLMWLSSDASTIVAVVVVVVAATDAAVTHQRMA